MLNIDPRQSAVTLLSGLGAGVLCLIMIEIAGSNGAGADSREHVGQAFPSLESLSRTTGGSDGSGPSSFAVLYPRHDECLGCFRYSLRVSDLLPSLWVHGRPPQGY